MEHEPLSETEVAHLIAALDDEYQARATYAQAIADFGDVRPFSNIVEAEGRHAGALITLFELYDDILSGTERADIREVYENLREASQERHLPAFPRCAERDWGPPDEGDGHRRRRRHRGG